MIRRIHDNTFKRFSIASLPVTFLPTWAGSVSVFIQVTVQHLIFPRPVSSKKRLEKTFASAKSLLTLFVIVINSFSMQAHWWWFLCFWRKLQVKDVDINHTVLKQRLVSEAINDARPPATAGFISQIQNWTQQAYCSEVCKILTSEINLPVDWINLL